MKNVHGSFHRGLTNLPHETFTVFLHLDLTMIDIFWLRILEAVLITV